MIRLLEHWALHRTLPTIHDTESLTTLQLNGTLVAKMNEVIKAYNEFTLEFIKKLEEYENSNNKDYEEFKTCITELCEGFIQTVETKLQMQDLKIEESIGYIKNNIETTVRSIIQEMIDSGEFSEAILNAFDSLQQQMNELKSKVTEIDESIETINTNLETLNEDNAKNKEDIAKNKQDIANLYFTNVAEMKANYSLKSGDVVKTIGYNSPNDYGGAFYKIVGNKTDDRFYEDLLNGLFAELLIEEKMNVKQFGVIGDGVTDVTEKYQKAINFICKYGDNYLFIPNGIYMINCIDETVDTNTTNHLKDSGGIKVLNGLTLEHDPDTVMKVIPNNKRQYNLYRIYDVENVCITGGSIKGDREDHVGNTGEWGYGIAITGSKNITIKNMKIENCWGDGINLQYAYDRDDFTQERKTPTDIYIYNVVSNRNRRQGMSIESGSHIEVKNSTFTNTGGTLPESGICIESANENSKVRDVTIDNCLFADNENRNLLLYGHDISSKITNVLVKDCTFKKCGYMNSYNISIESNVDDVIFDGNLFAFGDISRFYADTILLFGDGNYLIKNSVFERGNIKIGNDANVFIDNNIINYYGDQFLEISGMKKVLFTNNTIPKISKPLCVFTMDVTNTFIFKDNAVFGGTDQIALFGIDAAPDVKLIAYNNYLEKCIMTWYTINENQMIASGGIAGLYVEKNRPTNAKIGTMCFEKESGKLIIYTGSKWIYADGTDA